MLHLPMVVNFPLPVLKAKISPARHSGPVAAAMFFPLSRLFFPVPVNGTSVRRAAAAVPILLRCRVKSAVGRKYLVSAHRLSSDNERNNSLTVWGGERRNRSVAFFSPFLAAYVHSPERGLWSWTEKRTRKRKRKEETREKEEETDGG